MCSHPTVWRLIEHLKKEVGLQRFSMTQALAGQIVPTRKMYRTNAALATSHTSDSNDLHAFYARRLVSYRTSVANDTVVINYGDVCDVYRQ